MKSGHRSRRDGGNLLSWVAPGDLQWPRQMPVLQTAPVFDYWARLSAFADELPLCGWRRIGYIVISAGNGWCFEFRLSAPAGFREVHGKTPLHQVQYGKPFGGPISEYTRPDSGP